MNRQRQYKIDKTGDRTGQDKTDKQQTRQTIKQLGCFISA